MSTDNAINTIADLENFLAEVPGYIKMETSRFSCKGWWAQYGLKHEQDLDVTGDSLQECLTKLAAKHRSRAIAQAKDAFTQAAHKLRIAAAACAELGVATEGYTILDEIAASEGPSPDSTTQDTPS